MVTTLDDVRKIVLRLNPAEKVELISEVRKDIDRTFPGIESKPGVCGGSARVRSTRIAVWLLVGLRRDGVPDDRIVSHFGPGTIDHSDLSNAWAYAAAHPDEIDEEIRRNDEV